MGDTIQFAAGLLDSKAPVPSIIKGQIARRYGVYRNNVTMGLIRALEANFPALRKLLGEEYFFGFARDFAQSHPPQSPLMFRYGLEFPEALQGSDDLIDFPYLADVARLEILWRESYHAADAEPLTPEALSSIDPDKLFDSHFIAHPSTRLLNSSFAVADIFAANRTEEVVTVDDPFHSQCVLITRQEIEVTVQPISHELYVFFSALLAGEKLSEALAHVDAAHETFDLSAAFLLMLQSHSFQSIRTALEKT